MLSLVPVSLKDANAFVAAHHRHHKPVTGHKFSIGCEMETELDDDVFVKRLSAVDPDEIIRRGKSDFSTNKAALRFARVIWDKYNGQQRGGRKLPYRFKG